VFSVELFVYLIRKDDFLATVVAKLRISVILQDLKNYRFATLKSVDLGIVREALVIIPTLLLLINFSIFNTLFAEL
jgi:hypothetical protein